MPDRLRSRTLGLALLTFGMLAAGLLFAACDRELNPIDELGFRNLARAEASLQKAEQLANTARAAAAAAEAAALACDPGAAAEAAATVADAAAAVERESHETIAAAGAAAGQLSQVNNVGTARATSVLASVEALIAETAALVPQAEAAVPLAQQRLDADKCDSAVDDTSDGSRTGGSGGESVRVGVLLYQDARFPLEQFRLVDPVEDRCGEPHYHAGTAFSLEGGEASDPAPSRCGFGAASSAETRVVDISQDEFQAYRDALAGGD